MRAKSRPLVNFSTLLLCSSLVLPSKESFLSPVNTAIPEISSIRLSPPNASRAKLPAISPSQMDPKTSTNIQAELRYSTLIPLPILACLHDWCAVVQQHEAQLTQPPGVRHSSHDSSAQQQVTHDDDEEDTPNAKAEPMPDSYHSSSYESRSLYHVTTRRFPRGSRNNCRD